MWDTSGFKLKRIDIVNKIRLIILKVAPDTYQGKIIMEYKKEFNRIKNKNVYDKDEKPLIDERPNQPKGNQQILTDSK